MAQTCTRLHSQFIVKRLAPGDRGLARRWGPARSGTFMQSTAVAALCKEGGGGHALSVRRGAPMTRCVMVSSRPAVQSRRPRSRRAAAGTSACPGATARGHSRQRAQGEGSGLHRMHGECDAPSRAAAAGACGHPRPHPGPQRATGQYGSRCMRHDGMAQHCSSKGSPSRRLRDGSVVSAHAVPQTGGRGAASSRVRA